MSRSQQTAIIVDDEINLIEYLAQKLRRLWPELHIIGNAINGRQALALCAETEPDIVFLDIRMPGLSGLQVAEKLPATTQIVFVTAYDEFALQAFERAAVDYLVKPVEDARLQQTIHRLKSADPIQHSRLENLLAELSQGTPHYLQWLRTGLGDTTELIAVDDVIYFQADQKYTTVATRDKEYYVRMSVKELEQSLDPNQFWRIHRATLVRVSQIVQAKRDLRGRYTLTLRDSAATLRSSQTYGHLFKQM